MALHRAMATGFVQNKLKVGGLERLQELATHGRGAVDLLDEVIEAFYNTVPFQSICYLAQPLEQRRVQTSDEVVQAVLSGRGGVCWTNNVFMYLLLTALGYDAYTAMSDVQVREAQDHVVVIVRDLTHRGSRHLVEVGYGNPTFRSVSLDFREETETYTQSFRTFKYIKEGRQFARLRHCGPKRPSGFEFTGDWAYCYWFTTQERSLDYIAQKLQKNQYVNPDMMLATSVRLVKWVKGKAFVIKDHVILEEGDDHRMHTVQTFTTHQEVMTAIMKYYPEFDREDIEKAFRSSDPLRYLDQ